MATTKPVDESAAAESAARLGFKFATEENSPFPDGYSIAGEEKILTQEVIEAVVNGDIPDTDPRYDRVFELLDRKENLERARRAYDSNKGAEAVVAFKEVRSMDALGALVDEEEDAMRLHTKEAFRMFMGRAREPGNPDSMPIVGGKRVAAALRGLWLLTANDNPYADWALIRHEQAISKIQKALAFYLRQAAARLEAMKKKGLKYSLLLSAHPQTLSLGYRSPYGYAVSNLIVDFDYYVRVQKTLARKNLHSDLETRRAIASISRKIRGVFYETVRFERWLTQEEIKGLCRADFVPDAGEESKKRVAFVTETFGMVPAEVYTARLQPRHSRRRANLTPAERQLLQSVGEKLEQMDVGAGAAAPEEQKEDAANA
ncbi:MAG: TIGR03761 family integrating conjugative element protein [Deltaproteobacteria bacterium]|nr:TIGR03761 family integrating conjugative element protein [Deltaproteobacteria bacterium]